DERTGCWHRGIPEIRVLRGKTHHARSGARDQKWRTGRPRTARRELAVTRLIVFPGEVDATILEQRPNDLDRLGEAGHAVVEGDAEGTKLRLVPAGADPQDEASPADLVERHRHLCHDRRVA